MSTAPTTESDVSAILTRWRRAMEINQEMAALLLGVPVKTLQGWEQGRPMPHPRLLTLALINFRHPLSPVVLAP
jgi:DNA-binding transcriptional regulator YiaG